MSDRRRNRSALPQDEFPTGLGDRRCPLLAVATHLCGNGKTNSFPATVEAGLSWLTGLKRKTDPEHTKYTAESAPLRLLRQAQPLR